VQRVLAAVEHSAVTGSAWTPIETPAAARAAGSAAAVPQS
jgi:hypothetical protein